MRDYQKPSPPRWAERFLAWYCRPELLEDLQGDLNEYFERNVKTRGLRRARLIYCIDALKFFRPYTLRKPAFINLLIQWIMIGSYIKTSSRSIVRNKLFSAINIVGLAISMSVGLLMIAFIADLFSYDDFHEKGNRIYRVITAVQLQGQPPMEVATTSVLAGKKIQETVSGVEDLTIMRRGFGGDAVIGETTIPLGGLWADESFLKVFSFPLLQGDPSTALKEPYSLVLTEVSAKKLFGDANALGKYVKFDTTNYVVTGVLKDIPKFSHLRFEALVSFSTAEIQKPDTDGGFLSWGSIFMNYVYVVLPEKNDPSAIQASLDLLTKAENTADNAPIGLSLQPLREIVLGKSLGNPAGPVMDPIAIWILCGLAFVVILSACFNYTNLSIARSLRRSREIGVRKVIGALKGHVLAQFITESVIISLLALTISFFLFLFLRVQFLSLADFIENLASLSLSPVVILSFIALAIVIGMTAGFLPALFFSRINAIQVLKDASSVKVFRHVTTRKALIVIQYTFSLIFITATIIGYNQYKSFISFDLGFSTENILNIRVDGTDADRVVKELSELPEVNGISTSLLVSSLGSTYSMQMKYPKNPHDSAGVLQNFVNEHYLTLHEYTFLAGRNFNPKPDSAEESEIIVNEQLLQRLDIGKRDPQQAVGEEVAIDGKKLTIVGVVKDFHYRTLLHELSPAVFRYATNRTYGYINAKISTHDWPVTLASIEKAWRKIDPVHPLDAKFYDDQIEEAYRQFAVMIKIIGFLAFLAVCIASMGLFGMVVFTTETRLKEISIRKVLGASEGRLIYLLSKGFLGLLVLAASIALPLTYLFFDKVVLTKFAYHPPIGFGEMVIAGASVMILAFFMIISQTLKTARSNPAEVLKNE
jgi:putative ABC transport system permease protein